MAPLPQSLRFLTAKRAKGDSSARESLALDRCETFAQGYVIQISRLPYLSNNKAHFDLTPDGVVIVSQTCDVVRRERSTVIVAPLVGLEGQARQDAVLGKRLRYVHVPHFRGGMFADLDRLHSLHKSELLVPSVETGIAASDLKAQRDFARRVGRRFSRFPFPDLIQPWIRPLQELAQSASNKNSGPRLALFRAISEIRIASPDWSSEAADLSVHLILPQGELPELDEFETEPISGELSRFLAGKRDISAIADRLFPETRERPEGADRDRLWREIARQFCALIEATGSNAKHSTAVRAAVRSVEVEVVSEYEYRLSQYNHSESLDLDHLSAPTPRNPNTRA